MTPSRLIPSRRVAWWLSLLLVLLAHACVGHQVLDSQIGDGDASTVPEAIDVAFVRELAPTTPPVLAAATPPVPVAAAAQPASSPAKAASSPDAAASTPPRLAAGEALPELGAPEPVIVPPVAQAASTPPPVIVPGPLDAPAGLPPATTAAATAASAPVAQAMDWPPSTRLRYKLEGNFRGPLFGTAQVEWLRQEAHYQVRLGVKVDPVFERRMLSDGTLTAAGLVPRRYDQQTDIPFRGTRTETVQFDDDVVRLANGQSVERPAGVQDTASQFVQMTWLFLSRPQQLQVGQSVEFPLALPRRVGRWTYDVVEKVELALPFGTVEAFHLKPRLTGSRPNELSVEMWIAPSLQYLPVRIGIRQDAETWLDLQLQQRPQQAAPR